MGGVYYHFYRWNLKGSVKGGLSEESLDHLNCRLDKEVCQITSEDFSKKRLAWEILWIWNPMGDCFFWYGLVIYKRGICEWNYSNDKTKLCMAISIEFGLSLNNVCNVICDDENSQFFVKYCRFEFRNVIALYKDK